MKYGLYADPEGRYSVCIYRANRGWSVCGDGIEFAVHQLDNGEGWGLNFTTDRDLAIHILDFDSLPQLYSDHPEIFI